MIGSEQILRELQDRAAIRELLASYAHAVDRRDLPAVAACFTPHAVYRGSLGEGTIEVALRALSERMQRYSSTMHLLGTQSIALDGESARSETNAIVYHRLNSDEGHGDFIVGVRYVDELRRNEGRWLICNRRTTVAWERFDPVVERSTN
jgi:3-phenylpropionate/cinnamic acid dioxygenase small subunit